MFRARSLVGQQYPMVAYAKARLLGHASLKITSRSVENTSLLKFRWNIMVRHCIAFGCTSRSSKEDCRGLAWNSFPLSNKNLLQKWLVKIRREDTPVNKNSYLCSKYFEPECFVKSLGGQRMRLKPDAIPTKFIFSAEKPRRKIPSDRQATTTTTKKSSDCEMSQCE